MTPGWEASYVSKISAVLNGSLTPHEIRWELSVADGMRFVTCWWNHFFERAIGVVDADLLLVGPCCEVKTELRASFVTSRSVNSFWLLQAQKNQHASRLNS